MNVHSRPDGATLLLRDDRDGVALLTLNNPAARNALSEELIVALATAFDAIGRDPSVRAVIVAANGPAFSAGPRSEATDGAALRSRWRQGLFSAHHDDLQRHDADRSSRCRSR